MIFWFEFKKIASYKNVVIDYVKNNFKNSGNNIWYIFGEKWYVDFWQQGALITKIIKEIN